MTATPAPAAPPTMAVQGLVRSFADHRVLDGVDLAVVPGTIHALLGSNGAGRTTLVRILATLLRPDSGTATVGGHDVVHAPDAARSVFSLTGQATAVDGVLIGREKLVLLGRLRHVPNPGRIAADLLARFSLADAGARRTATYSGDMRRRLDIAMSLVAEPAVLYLDEPTTGRDPQARIEVWETCAPWPGAE